MALPSNTVTSYIAIGQREDLSDDIFRIDPTDTPFFTMCEKTKATGVVHEWQTQALAAVDSTNQVLEGDDATTDAQTASVRLTNICQISDKVVRVSGTVQAVETAGRDDELAYQETLKGLELRRDMETMLCGTNIAKDAGSASVTRKSATVLSWIGTNDDIGSGSAASPSALLGANTRTDGTTRAFTEVQLKNSLQLIWTSGGKPDVISLGAFNKQVMSTFTGRAQQTEDTSKKTIVAVVDSYVSDFGKISCVANRFQRSRDALIYQSDMWAIPFLRKMVSIPLSVTGDSTRRQVLSEYTLECRNEKANGGVFDLTVS